MGERTLPVDRSIRLNVIKNLRSHEGIRNGLKWFHENPDEFKSRIDEFDIAISCMKFDTICYRSTGMFLDNPKHVHAKRLEIMLTEDKNLPKMSEIDDKSQGEIKNLFSNINKLLSDDWSWATKLNPEETASGLLIEGYGLMLEEKFQITGLRRAFVEAFEEELILNHTDFKLFKDVLIWMKEEKSSFSETVQGQINRY